MTATTAADTTGAVTHTSISRLAQDGQVLVQVTSVPLAITKWILSRNSIALLGITIASMEAQYPKKIRFRLDPWENADQVKPFLLPGSYSQDLAQR